MTNDLIRKTAWWAPLGVLVLHQVVMWLGMRGKTDWLLHMTGGLAITYFIWTTLPFVERSQGSISKSWKLVIAFFGGCTIALFWDLAEFASDTLLGSEIQQSLQETMLDLTYGVGGAAAMSFVIFAREKLKFRGTTLQIPEKDEQKIRNPANEEIIEEIKALCWGPSRDGCIDLLRDDRWLQVIAQKDGLFFIEHGTREGHWITESTVSMDKAIEIALLYNLGDPDWQHDTEFVDFDPSTREKRLV